MRRLMAFVVAAGLAAGPSTGLGSGEAKSSHPRRRPQVQRGDEQRDARGRVVYSRTRGRISYGGLVAPLGRPGPPPPRYGRTTRAVDERPPASPGPGPDALQANEAGTVPTLNLEWFRAVFGVGIGETGLHAADVDGDGEPEILAAAGPSGFGANGRWYVLSRQGADYVHEWASFPYPAAIEALRLAPLDADAPLEVLLAVGDEIRVYDGATRRLERTIRPGVGTIQLLEVGDVDADGAPELVLGTSSDLIVLDAATGIEEGRGTGLGGSDLALGQVDADPALEIVVGRGGATGWVVDGATRAAEWTNEAGFGDLVRTADLDADGLAEIVAARRWGGITVYEGDTRTERYSVPVTNLGAVRAADVDGNGTPELLYGDAQWGGIHALDGASGTELWSIPNPDHGVTDIAVGQVDDDPALEVLWGAGFSSSGADHLHVGDTVTRVREWESLDISGRMYGLDHGDVDGDGAPEILSTTLESASGYDDGLYFFHDAATHALEFQSPEATGSDFAGVWRARSGPLDADAPREVVLTTAQGYSGFLVAYDGATHAEEWRTGSESGLGFRALEIADVDEDSQLEVVAGTGRLHTGATGVYVLVYDAATGALEWRSPDLAPGFGSLELLRVANVDGDVQPEIVVADHGGGVSVLDAVTRSVRSLGGGHVTTALDTPDRDGNGTAEIVVGTATGAILALDPVTGAVTESLGSHGAAINGLAFADVSGDGTLDLLFALGERLRVVDGQVNLPVFVSPVLGTGVGASDSLRAADVDGDETVEALVNTGGGFAVFGVEVVAGAGPDVTWISPVSGATLSGSASVEVAASDADGVGLVEFYVDGILRATDVSPPFTWDWSTNGNHDGPYTLRAVAADALGHVGMSPPLEITVDNGRGQAVVGILTKVPTCAQPAPYCDSGTLLQGRGQMGPEPNQPNTVYNSCGDGGFGAYQWSESNEWIRVSTLDGTRIGVGKRVRVDVRVWATARYSGGSGPRRRPPDRLYLFHSAHPSSNLWTPIGYFRFTEPGEQLRSVEFTLPAGEDLQVVRAALRDHGGGGPCMGGWRNDHDDLVFGVE